MRVRTQLKDIVSFSKGKQINGDELLVSGKYDYLNGGVLPSGKWNEYNTAGKTVTISEGGNSCGFVNFMEKPFWCGAHCYYLFEPKINAKYLYYALKSQQSELMKIRSGACMPNIKKNDLGKFEIIYDTDINEQFKTIKVLDTVSLMIVVCQKQLQKLDELVKSRFIELFGDSEHNTRNWPTAKLSSLCYVGSSKRIYQSELTDNGIPFLRISDLNERIDGKDNDPQLFISTEKFDELRSNRLIPLAGDVLVTTRGTLGRCYIIKESDSFYFQDGMISWLSNICDSITSLYVSELFATAGVQKQIANLQAGSTVAYLSIAMLKKLDIMLPPLALQNQFAAFVEQVDKSKFVVQQTLDKAQELFDSLMQKYFG